MISLLLLLSSAAAEDATQNLIRCIQNRDRGCMTKELETAAGQSSPAYLSAAAEAYLLLGRNQDAVMAIERALKKEPGNHALLIQQGRTYQRSGDQVRAIQCFLLGAKTQSPSSSDLYDIGMSFFLLREYERAGKHFKHAVQLDGKNHKAEFMLAVIDIMKDDDQAGAKLHLERALAIEPDNPHYLLHYGIVLAQRNDNEAAAVLERAVKADPSNPLAHFNLGRLRRQLGEVNQARAELEAAVRLRPELARAHYQLASVYRALGENAKAKAAIEQFERFKDQDRDDEPVDGPPSYAFRDLPSK